VRTRERFDDTGCAFGTDTATDAGTGERRVYSLFYRRTALTFLRPPAFVGRLRGGFIYYTYTIRGGTLPHISRATPYQADAARRFLVSVSPAAVARRHAFSRGKKAFCG
jgi:hypothetical protein